MKLSELTDLLQSHPGAGLAFVLPDGSGVAPHFHVTEVGRVRKDFIDCGGAARQSEACVLQVWVANDVDHRLEAGKLGKIIALAEGILRGADLPVEIEYDVGVITQFAVSSVEAGEEQITLRLAGKHTGCLAPELCKVDGGAGGGTDAGGGCCADDDGCCAPGGQEGSVLSLGVDQGKCC